METRKQTLPIPWHTIIYMVYGVCRRLLANLPNVDANVVRNVKFITSVIRVRSRNSLPSRRTQLADDYFQKNFRGEHNGEFDAKLATARLTCVNRVSCVARITVNRDDVFRK